MPPPLGDLRQSLEESRSGLSLHLASWSSPRPASLLFTGLFCSVQSLFHVVALFFPFFLFDTPFDDVFFDCSEGEGVGGKAWLLGGTSTCGKPKVKHIPFLVLESLSPTRHQCPGSRPGCYGSSKVLRKPWLPFPRGRCPPFRAGPLPITLTCPLPAPSWSLSRWLHSVSISFLSRMVHLSPSLPGLPPHPSLLVWA